MRWIWCWTFWRVFDETKGLFEHISSTPRVFTACSTVSHSPAVFTLQLTLAYYDLLHQTTTTATEHLNPFSAQASGPSDQWPIIPSSNVKRIVLIKCSVFIKISLYLEYFTGPRVCSRVVPLLGILPAWWYSKSWSFNFHKRHWLWLKTILFIPQSGSSIQLYSVLPSHLNCQTLGMTA